MVATTSLQQIARAFPLDWSMRRRYRLCDTTARELGSYYIRWAGDRGALGEWWDGAPLDGDGVLLSRPQRVYHATRIAQYALEQHARFCETSDPEAARAFVAQARWLRDNQVSRNGIPGCYPFAFGWPAYGAKPGFLSAMTQGEAISVLLRAYQLFDDSRYLQAAKLAATPFRRDVVDGGVAWRAREDVFLEEAACAPPSHILNGWIYALWGLSDLARCWDGAWVADVYGRSLQTLGRRLPLYDCGHWSYYNLLASRTGFRKFATLKYHAFHVAQLRVLASMSGEPAYEATAARWESYANSFANRARVWGNAAASLPAYLLTHADTVPGGARSIV